MKRVVPRFPPSEARPLFHRVVHGFFCLNWPFPALASVVESAILVSTLPRPSLPGRGSPVGPGNPVAPSCFVRSRPCLRARWPVAPSARCRLLLARLSCSSHRFRLELNSVSAGSGADAPKPRPCAFPRGAASFLTLVRLLVECATLARQKRLHGLASGA